jgi:hypothetical protein
MTREEYLNSDSPTAHQEYYSQFVTDATRSLVVSWIGLDKILASKDEYFNDIPLARWDSLCALLPPGTAQRLRERGDYLTLADAVCICKCAARMIREEHKQKHAV